jgi:hypothetical protein
MARTIAILPAGSRITDYVSLGVIAKTFRRDQVDAVLAATGKASIRQRELPAHVVVYYVIALALYMQCSYREVLRCLLEGVQWLMNPSIALKVAAKSGISQARTRLGWEPVRQLHDAVVAPIARPATRGAWYRGWRLVSLDGSSLDVADERSNAAAFGRPAASRGASAYPQLRFVALVENGTHVLFGTQMGPYGSGETSLAKGTLGALRAGMLCLADRQFFNYGFWRLAQATGADLLWRLKAKAKAGARTNPGRRLVSEPRLPLGQGSPPPDQWPARAGDRLPPSWRGRGGAPLSPGHHPARPGARAGPRAGRPLS